MSKQIVDKLRKEINWRNQKEVVDSLEEMLSENIKEISKIESFFYLPLQNIFNIFSRFSFDSIDESEDVFVILKNIIKNTINAHNEEKETILILQKIDFSQLILSFEKIISIFGLFTNCPILQQFCSLYNEKEQLPEKDYEYELKRKDQEIEKLKQRIIEVEKSKQQTHDSYSPQKIAFKNIMKKPDDYESDIFRACRAGKLSSV